MLTASWRKYILDFIKPGGTSRGVMTQRTSWFITLANNENPEIIGIGECPPLPGLSRDPIGEMEQKLEWVCHHINEPNLLQNSFLNDFPSIKFGLETAFSDLKSGGRRIHFNDGLAALKHGIPINGLIWMDTIDIMFKQVETKILQGFDCLKFKIGVNIDIELELLNKVRQKYGWDIQIRVDANGAFTLHNISPILKKLADLEVHSIEQPISDANTDELKTICKTSPIQIAIDENIVKWNVNKPKFQLLDAILPHFLVLKPGLIGGFSETLEWISLAEERGIGWWITSALESNIGLNAIAQFTAQWQTSFRQGLGTGQVFQNNLTSPLRVQNGKLFYDASLDWDLTLLD